MKSPLEGLPRNSGIPFARDSAHSKGMPTRRGSLAQGPFRSGASVLQELQRGGQPHPSRKRECSSRCGYSVDAVFMRTRSSSMLSWPSLLVSARSKSSLTRSTAFSCTATSAASAAVPREGLSSRRQCPEQRPLPSISGCSVALVLPQVALCYPLHFMTGAFACQGQCLSTSCHCCSPHGDNKRGGTGGHLPTTKACLQMTRFSEHGIPRQIEMPWNLVLDARILVTLI